MKSSLSKVQYRANRKGTHILVAADRDIVLNLLKDGYIKVNEADQDANVQVQIISARERKNIDKPAKACLKYYIDVKRPFNGTPSDFNHLESIYALDTNYKIVDSVTNIKMCVCVSGKFQTNRDKDYSLGGLFQHNISFAFFTKLQNPELLSLHWLIHEILNSENYMPEKQIGIVIDSEYDNQDRFNNREAPYIGNHYLPPNFTLIYASADSCGAQFANKMVKICEKDAKKALQSMTNEDIQCKQELGDKLFHIHKKIKWD